MTTPTKKQLDAAGERARNKQRQQQQAEHDAERERAEQRSVGRVLLSADDLFVMGIPYSRTQLWKMWKQGQFPAPIKISKSRSAWVASEVKEWLETRKSERAA